MEYFCKNLVFIGVGRRELKYLTSPRTEYWDIIMGLPGVLGNMGTGLSTYTFSGDEGTWAIFVRDMGA